MYYLRNELFRYFVLICLLFNFVLVSNLTAVGFLLERGFVLLKKNRRNIQTLIYSNSIQRQCQSRSAAVQRHAAALRGAQ